MEKKPVPTTCYDSAQQISSSWVSLAVVGSKTQRTGQHPIAGAGLGQSGPIFNASQLERGLMVLKAKNQRDEQSEPQRGSLSGSCKRFSKVLLM